MSTETPTPANHNLERPITKGDLIDCLGRLENEFARSAEYYRKKTDDPYSMGDILMVVMSDCREIFRKVNQEILERP